MWLESVPRLPGDVMDDTQGAAGPCGGPSFHAHDCRLSNFARCMSVVVIPTVRMEV
jgi:hypothetical protein